jgi:hypothetical protein
MIWLLITVIGILSAYIHSWWMISVVAFMLTTSMGNSWGNVILQSSLAGVAASAVLTAIAAIRHGMNIYDPLAQVIMLPSGWVMALITVMIGGILAGLGGAAGYSLRTIFKKKRRR